MEKTAKNWHWYWKDFTNYSTINGFGFIHAAACTFERLLWALMLIFAAILTLRDIEIEVDTYLEGPVITTASLVESKPLELEAVTLCFPLDIIQLYNRTSFIQKLNNHPSLTVGFISETQKKFNINELMAFLSKQSDPTENLKELGSLICKELGINLMKFRLNISNAYEKITADVCQPDSVSWLGPDPDFFEEVLCLNLSLLEFYNRYDNIQITWNVQPWQLSGKTHRKASISLSGPSVITQNTENFIQFSPTKFSTVLVERTNRLQKLQPCGGVRSYIDFCRLNCTAHLLYSDNNCLPYPFQSFVPSLPTFAVCPLNLTLNTSDTSDCLNNCMVQCQSDLYVFFVDSDKVENTETPSTTAGILIYANRFLYINMVEAYARDIHSLIATIAGIMGGSYIGVTFLALMHILIFPIKILCHKLFDKTVDIDHQRTASFLDRRFSLRFDHGFPEWNNTDTEAEERKLAEISAEFFNHLHIRNDETAL